MKSIKTKIQAFTLSEMLVVLLLTVIVVGLAFSILSLVQKQMNTAKDNFETKTELNQLKQALWRDFRTFTEINFQNEQLTLKNEINQVNYNFVNDYIIRKTDTFYIRLNQKQLYFDGEVVTSGIVNALVLETSKAAGGKKIFVYRENAADIYMKD
ncbi:hypothetical protein [uncultured Croceitalea sp.]|uniref:hypothetical protein n=1 Tax=uncultured Croceitalea sp. TaxID=1798908 RepID=UPI00374FA73B